MILHFNLLYIFKSFSLINIYFFSFFKTSFIAPFECVNIFKKLINKTLINVEDKLINKLFNKVNHNKLFPL